MSLSDDAGHDLLVRGIAAAKSNSRSEARFFLERALASSPAMPDRIQAWRYLADLSESPAEKREYIGKILAVDPTDGLARRGLAILEGRLEPADVIDPEHLPPQSTGPQAASGRRFACRQCGSPDVFYAPDGHSLVCEQCRHSEPVDAAGALEPPTANDFAAAMWAARGHRRPIATQSFACKACGAAFLLRPEVLSLTCPYCRSVYVIEQLDRREFIPPDAIIPFAISQDDAARRLREWMQKEEMAEHITPPRGVYQPVWIFGFLGEVEWRGMGHSRDQAAPMSGSYVVVDCFVRVAAGRGLTNSPTAIVDEFDVGTLVPYDPQQLADWPAETYAISLEDAAVAARQRALAKLRPEVTDSVGPAVQDLQMHFLKVGIDSFQLVLLPLWLASVDHRGSSFRVIVNGRTGTMWADRPTHGIRGWVARWLGG